jgi:serine protease Do
MRAGKAIGVALAVFVAAAIAVVWQAPPVAAAGQQAVTADRPKPAEPQVGKQVEKKVIIKKQEGDGPVVVSHALVGEPLVAALAGGPRLGVGIRDLMKDDLAKLKLTSLNGVLIESVTKDSAAEKAGVKAGDVVVQYDGENVRTAQQFTRLVRESVAGRAVKMAVMRDARRTELEVAPAMSDAAVTLDVVEEKLRDAGKNLFYFDRRLPEPGEQPAPPGGRTFRWRPNVPMPAPEGDLLQWFNEPGNGSFLFSAGRGRLGVTVEELTPELAVYFGVKDGLLVNAVQAESPAAKAGIKAGDVIGSVNGKAVTSSSELVKELADKDGEVTIGVTRDKRPLSLKATLEPRKQQLRHRTIVGRPA